MIDALPLTAQSRNVIAPYAVNPDVSRARRHPEPPPTFRSEYQRDRDRIVHSVAFRRLEYKPSSTRNRP